MLLLALDTSTTAITAALHDGSGVLAEATTLDSRAHGERLAPAVVDVLARAGASAGELTHIVVGVGPGPFTGLRVGIVTARTLAFVVGARLHGVCSLDALAFQAAGAGAADELLVATDARRKEVYWACYRQGRRVDGPHVGRAADLPESVRRLPSVGRGPVLYPDQLTGIPGGPLDVSAAALAELAVRRLRAGEDLADSAPLYLRRPDAVPAGERTGAGR